MSIEALTPEGIRFYMTPAGLPVRTLAYSIDEAIQWAITIVVFLIWNNFFNWQFGFWIFLILRFCLEWFYHVIFELAFSGQSPGKRITGIRVVKCDGSPVTPSASFMRNLLRFADTFCNLFHIAFLSMTVTEGFRRIGDWAGNTAVVYIQSGSFQKTNIDYLSGYTSIVPPFTLSADEMQGILNFARRYPILGESRANEIASLYAPLLRKNSFDLLNEEPHNNTSALSDAAYLLGIARYLYGDNIKRLKEAA